MDNEELRKRLVHGLSKAQLYNVGKEGEAVIEEQADSLLSFIEADRERAVLEAKIEEHQFYHRACIMATDEETVDVMNERFRKLTKGKTK